MALSTVSGGCGGSGSGKRSRLEPPEPPNRYERKRPGRADPRRRQEARADRPARAPGDRQRASRGIAHRRRAGSRLGVRPRLRRRRHPPGLRRGARRRGGDDRRRLPAAGGRVVWSMGITVERVMSDNGSCYRSHVHAQRLPRARPPGTSSPSPTGRGPTARPSDSSRRSRTAGPTARSTASSAERTAALPGWLTHYNFTRRHGSLGHKAPAARLAELEQPSE